MMKHFAFVVLLIIVVSLTNGCSRTTQEQAEINKPLVASLPEGCSIAYYGKYATEYERIPVLAVVCDGKKTTTVNSLRAEKGSPPQAVVVMEDIELEEKLSELKLQEIEIRRNAIIAKLQKNILLSEEEKRFITEN